MSAAHAQTVYVVDDDKLIRTQLVGLLERAGIAAKAYASAFVFLAELDSEQRGCLLLDVNMPGMTGLELQAVLAKRGIRLPIVFLTGYGTIPMAVDAIKAGATGFLEKPIDNRFLLEAVMRAFEEDSRLRAREDEQSARQQLLGKLTPRELQVMDCLIGGKSNKEIARTLDISVRTVEIHRAHVMEKLSADSVADVVRLVMQATGDETASAGR